MSSKLSFGARAIMLTLFIFVFGIFMLGLDPAPAQSEEGAPAPPESFSGLVQKVKMSVVNISAVKVVKREGVLPFQSPFGSEDPFKDFFEKFFGDRLPKEFKQKSLGSGFIIDKDGFILTNNHVVEKTEDIEVTLSDGQVFGAKIIGRDSKTDLALIRIETETSLKPVPLGDSDELDVGDWVVAIGSPFGLGNTVTAGIVSAKYRQIGAGAYDDFIQTDASINPGNSGGPLLNTDGQVVRINTAIFSQTGGNIGIGFAIPVNMAKELLPQLKEGKVVRGWLGVMIQQITPQLKDKLDLETENGALVADVTEEGPAEEAGIRRGDVIVSFDGKEIEEMRDLPFIVATTPVGKKVTVEVIREGEKKNFTVELGEMKEEKEPEKAEEAEGELGMTLRENSPELAEEYNLPVQTGVVVVNIVPNSAAASAGLKPGDIILEVDQEPLKDLDDFRKKTRPYESGETLLLLVNRQGSTLFITLEVP
jgi:serine protease Do